jgi:hypothetical protein
VVLQRGVRTTSNAASILIEMFNISIMVHNMAKARNGTIPRLCYLTGHLRGVCSIQFWGRSFRSCLRGAESSAFSAG